MSRIGRLAILVGLASAFVACQSSAPAARVEPANSAADSRAVVLCLGTSLTAGYGVEPEQAWPALLQQKLDAEALRLRVVNAGVSGETSAGALSRADWVLRQKPRVLVLETGANDGPRGQDIRSLEANLTALLRKAKALKPPPRSALVAMQALTNYGVEYRAAFQAVYPRVARAEDVTLTPFLLEGVAGRPELNQDDGIHPNPEGHRRVAENLWKALGPLLRAAAAEPSAVSSESPVGPSR